MTKQEVVQKLILAINKAVVQSEQVIAALADFEKAGLSFQSMEITAELCLSPAALEIADATQSDARFLESLRIDPDLEVRE